MAEMKERLQRELLRRSEEISLEQKLQSAQKAAEERAEKAILRSEFAEQRAIAAEKKFADLEMQMAATTTDLTNSAIALQVAEAAKNRCIEEATTEKAKVAEIMERLSESEAEKSSLQKQAETSLELRNQLANAAQQQKELATKAKQDEKRCKDLMEQIARLKTHISHSDEMEKTRQAEIECLKEKEIELQNDLKQSQKEIGDVSAAMCAAEQRVAPLETEASRCREEANEATREAKQRRLEAEATRMAHYEQETKKRHIQEPSFSMFSDHNEFDTLNTLNQSCGLITFFQIPNSYCFKNQRQICKSGLDVRTERCNACESESWCRAKS